MISVHALKYCRTPGIDCIVLDVYSIIWGETTEKKVWQKSWIFNEMMWMEFVENVSPNQKLGNIYH